jgi:hypothetical protein
VRENAERKRREREAFLKRQAEEWEAIRGLVERGRLRISELGAVPTATRLRLLQWIGRCSSAPKHTFVTPEGVRISMTNALTEERAVLVSEDGELHLPDYELEFALTDAAREVAAVGAAAPRVGAAGVTEAEVAATGAAATNRAATEGSVLV